MKIMRRVMTAVALFGAASLAHADHAVRARTTAAVRTGPGSGYAAMGHVPEGQVYVASAKSGSWWKIYFNGRQGYTYAPSYTILSGQTGVRVSTEVLNVRTGPGLGHSIVGHAYSGQVYWWSGMSGGWYHIYFGGAARWVYGGLVRRVSLSGGGSSSPAPAPPPPSGSRTNLNMAWYRQVNDYFCGPTAAQMIIRYVSGRYYDQWTVNRVVGANSWSGSSCDSIARGIRYYSGDSYYVVRGFNRSRVISNINRNKPVEINFKTRYLAYTGYRDFMHHSVIKGYTSGGFYIHDTAWGPNKWASSTQVWNAVNYHYGLYIVRY